MEGGDGGRERDGYIYTYIYIYIYIEGGRGGGCGDGGRGGCRGGVFGPGTHGDAVLIRVHERS